MAGKYKYLLILLISFFSCVNIYIVKTEFYGVIYDRATKNPIAGASVIIEEADNAGNGKGNIKYSITTGNDGKYSYTQEKKDYYADKCYPSLIIHVKMIGYVDQSILLNGCDKVNYDFYLFP